MHISSFFCFYSYHVDIYLIDSIERNDNMGFLINEEKLMEDNIFKFENRLNSQLTRFLDKSPVFVTYYHVNVNETTTDEGFRDIESIIGNRSPLRFQKIENFPMYGLDQVVLAIQDSEQGLDTEYSGEAVILPNTIKPLQNDIFKINHVKGSFLFRVTEVQYDNIRPDNYYKINFRFEWLDDEKADKLDEQVEENFSCILQNIGTEENCLIQEDYYKQLKLIDEMFNDMVKTYKILFYNERYNCFLWERLDGYKIYDPFQTVFFNNHKLLNNKADYSTIMLSEEFNDHKRKLKYERSIYRCFERRDTKLLSEFKYHTIPGTYKKDSSFARWNDQSIMIVEIPSPQDDSATESLLTQDIINTFKMNGPTDSKYVELMQKFIRNESMTIYDIPTNLNEELIKLDANEEVFFFTPILMYIIQTVVNDFLSEKKI